MDYRLFMSCVFAVCTLASPASVANRRWLSEAQVQWYRTAQNTQDRLTRQPDTQFGPDFPADTVVTINRYLHV